MGQIETRQLPVALTQQELLDRGERVADIQRQLDDAEAALKAYKSAHKSQVEGLDATRRHLSHEIRHKQEIRQVEVDIRKNWDEARVETWRCDTGELVSSRPMTPSERQRDIGTEVN